VAIALVTGTSSGIGLATAVTLARGGHKVIATMRARSTSQECLCSNEIAELRHRDASQRQRRRVAAQGDPLQCAGGSPAASARAPAVISESIGIPSHL
jgi:NAD(P)-dependent dehydrogenase (short-subunit alcohol dehydrogenase family)